MHCLGSVIAPKGCNWIFDWEHYVTGIQKVKQMEATHKNFTITFPQSHKSHELKYETIICLLGLIFCSYYLSVIEPLI